MGRNNLVVLDNLGIRENEMEVDRWKGQAV
jgi:hypothetical protein